MLFTFFLCARRAIVATCPRPALVVLCGHRREVIKGHKGCKLVVRTIRYRHEHGRAPFLASGVGVVFKVFVGHSGFIFVRRSFEGGVKARILKDQIVGARANFDNGPPFANEVGASLVRITLQRLEVNANGILCLFYLPVVIR